MLKSPYFYWRRYSRSISIVCILLFLESLLHISKFRVTRPSKPLDLPFSTGCQEPDIHGRRENAAIVMLARNGELEGAVKSVVSLEKQFNRWFHYPVIFLNDVPWEEDFIHALSEVVSGEVQFETIKNGSGMWGFPGFMDQDKAQASMAQQSLKGSLYAGMESYHHMCRFNSGYASCLYH